MSTFSLYHYFPFYSHMLPILIVVNVGSLLARVRHIVGEKLITTLMNCGTNLIRMTPQQAGHSKDVYLTEHCQTQGLLIR